MSDVFSDQIPKAAAEIRFATPVEADSREEYFRKILDELPAAIYVTDALGRITYFNEAAVTLWGGDYALDNTGITADYRPILRG